MKKPKIILGIETSCDETAAAVVEMPSYAKASEGKRVKILSNVVASSADLQAKYGGVIPEQAAREQLKSIIPVIQEALIQSNLYPPSSKNNLPSSIIYRPTIDAIAVTQGPGLIGSLLVGVETAKTLATIWQKPLIPVNHLLGHFYANWIAGQGQVSGIKYHGIKQKTLSEPIIHNTNPLPPKFPAIGLLVSGGHTDLILMKDHGQYEYLGGTRDDAAGECFDKSARLLDLPYPGGPNLSKLAEQGNPKAYKLPRPMINSPDFDFSFSGLKTAVANLGNLENLSDLAASIEAAIVDVLVKKTISAALKYDVDQIIVAGGVAANQKLRETLTRKISDSIPRARLFIPLVKFCTDNAAYIATAAFFNFHPIDPLKLQANPNLSLSRQTP